MLTWTPLLRVPKFHNQSIRFLLLPSASQPDSLFPILDTVSAADFTVIALSSEEEVDQQGETVLRCLTGLGVGGANGGVFGAVKVSFCDLSRAPSSVSHPMTPSGPAGRQPNPRLNDAGLPPLLPDPLLPVHRAHSLRLCDPVRFLRLHLGHGDRLDRAGDTFAGSDPDRSRAVRKNAERSPVEGATPARPGGAHRMGEERGPG